MERCDEPLNETGLSQTEETRNSLLYIDIDSIICSSLKRAKKTATVINRDKEFEGLENFDGYWDYYKNL